MALVAILAAAILQRRLLMANSDVSWLLTLAEKWLAGERLYVDILEINPPFAIWMSAPPVLLARLSGIRAETALDGLVLALAAASVFAAWRMIRARSEPVSRAWLPVVAFAALTLLPAAIFGEREHSALILFLPALCLAMRRAGGEAVRLPAACAIGVLSACMLCIKPHFALALGGAALTASWLARSWRLLFTPEYLIAGALPSVYATSLLYLYPAFWADMVPLVALLYLPARVPVLDMLNGGFPMLVAGGAIAAFLIAGKHPRAPLAPRVLVACASIAGFLAAALVQGKGWPYHFYPALALIVVLIAAAGLARASERGKTAALVAFACAGLFSAQFWLWFNSGIDMRAVEQPLRALGKNPRVLAISSDFAVAFPAVRAVDGIWAGRSIGHWIPYFVAGLAAKPGFDRSLLPAWREAAEKDRRQLAREIAEGRPDAILVERLPFDYLAWANADREIAALLTCFRQGKRYSVGNPEAPGGAGIAVDFFSVGACPPAPAEPARPAP